MRHESLKPRVLSPEEVIRLIERVKQGLHEQGYRTREKIGLSKEAKELTINF